MSDEREQVAERLRRIREEVRERALESPEPARLPETRPAAQRAASAPEPRPEPRADLAPPDGSAVNRLWETRAAETASGLRGFLRRALRRLLAPELDAQVRFNSEQVRLDNALLAYLDARLAETHRHYDAVLGIHGRHMGEIDERHLILQEELVQHVHDLVRRIDLVLAESDKGRLGLEHALRDVRERLRLVEERLARG